MKDYLYTFSEDTSITMHASGDCDCYCCYEYGYHSATAVHKPTGISADVTTIIREHQLIIDCPVDMAMSSLKGKVKSYIISKSKEASDILNDESYRVACEKKEESKRFSAWLKDRCTPTAEMLGVSPEIKKDKKPLHPGKIANDLLDLVPHKPVFNDLHRYEAEWREFAEGGSSIDYILAYRLSQCIEGTDVRFWMDLQERYDSFKDT